MDSASDMKTKILDVAIAQIEAEGERSLRLRKIAAAVGLTEPSLYHYFPNREALLVSSQARRIRTNLALTIDPFIAAVWKCTSREQFLEALNGVYRHSYQEERVVIRAVRAEIVGNAFHREGLRQAVKSALDEALAEAIKCLDFAQQQGWLRPGIDTSAFAMFNLSLISSLVFPEIYGDSDLLNNWKMLAFESITALVMRD
jgi:AcrR family transcriptional regulator